MADQQDTAVASAEGSASDESHGDRERGQRSEPTRLLLLTQTRSAISTKPKQRGTLRALGLGRIGKTNTLRDDAVTRGAIAKVSHLIKVEEVQP